MPADTQNPLVRLEFLLIGGNTVVFSGSNSFWSKLWSRICSFPFCQIVKKKTLPSADFSLSHLWALLPEESSHWIAVEHSPSYDWSSEEAWILNLLTPLAKEHFDVVVLDMRFVNIVLVAPSVKKLFPDAWIIAATHAPHFTQCRFALVEVGCNDCCHIAGGQTMPLIRRALQDSLRLRALRLGLEDEENVQ